jgi:hypothetical protein
MAFTTLMLAQLFNTVNARSDRLSALPHLFTNRWLWGAITLSVALQLLVLNVPPLQRAFGTVALSPGEWLRCLAVASTVLWLTEMGKVLRGAPGRGRRPGVRLLLVLRFALQVGTMGPFVGLNVLEAALGVAHSVQLLPGGAAVGRPMSLGHGRLSGEEVCENVSPGGRVRRPFS